MNTWLFSGSSSTAATYPEAAANFANSSIGVTPIIRKSALGGQNSAWMANNLAAAVATYRPAIVVIQGAPNDSSSGSAGLPAGGTAVNIRRCVSIARAAGAIPVLTTATPVTSVAYDQTKMSANNAMIRALGDELDVLVVDLATILANRTDYLGSDGIHLNPTGELIAGSCVAAAILGQVNPYPPSTYTVTTADTFDRADANIDGQTTSTGAKTWSSPAILPAVAGAVVIGTVGNALRRTAGTGVSERGLALVDSGSSLPEVTATLKTMPSTLSAASGGIVIAATADGHQFAYIAQRRDTSTPGLSLYQVTSNGGGVGTALGFTTEIVPVSGGVIRCVKNAGGTVSVYLNGVLAFTTSALAPALLSATYVGFYFGGGAAHEWENLSVATPA
ncbi:SGNH/GDSL hydrolase family protein [Kineosporia babensis]